MRMAILSACVLGLIVETASGQCASPCYRRPFPGELPAGVGVTQVNASAVFEGQVYVGTQDGLYRWSGSAWVQVGLDGAAVRALVVFDDLLWIGGAFSAPTMEAGDNVVAYDGSAFIDAGDIGGNALGESVGTFFIDGEGLLAGVCLESHCEKDVTPRPLVYQWNAMNEEWDAVGTPLGVYGADVACVNALLRFDPDPTDMVPAALYAAGAFSFSSVDACNNMTDLNLVLT